MTYNIYQGIAIILSLQTSKIEHQYSGGFANLDDW